LHENSKNVIPSCSEIVTLSFLAKFISPFSTHLQHASSYVKILSFYEFRIDLMNENVPDRACKKLIERFV